jgi:hypothetical protein
MGASIISIYRMPRDAKEMGPTASRPVKVDRFDGFSDTQHLIAQNKFVYLELYLQDQHCKTWD